MFVSIYLSFAFSQITEAEIFGGLFVLTVFSGLMLLPKLLKQGKLKEKVALSNASKAVIGLLASFLIGFLLVMRGIPVSYWRGWDPWINAPVAESIVVGGLDPFELGGKYAGVVSVGISGFYHFLAAFKVVTGFSFYSITRFGGPVLAGIVSMITYLVVCRFEGKGAGVLASFFFFLNPFVVTRFSMALRENFSYVFFLGVLFLLVVRRRANQGLGSRISFSLLLGLFLATTLCSHSLVPLIAYAMVCFDLVFFRFRDRRVFELILAIFFSLVLAVPYMPILVPTFAWVLRNQFLLSFEMVILLIVLTVGSLLVFVYFYKRLRGVNFSEGRLRRGVLVLSVILLLGAFYSILFPKTFTVLGSYNPPITLDMFALSSLLLACLGFLTVFRSSVPISIISLSLLLILIPNLTNVNVAFPLFRLVIYISWILSYGAAKLLRFIYGIHGKVRLEFSKSFRFFRKMFEIGNWNASAVVCVMILTLISPIMLQDIQTTGQRYSNYVEEDVESALNFISILEDDAVVVPQERTQGLLLYTGINISRMINNKTVLQELYSANSLQSFSRIILSNYPRTEKVYVFILQRFIGLENAPYPSEQFLKGVGERHQLGSVVYYTVPISYSEKELLESSIQVQFPAGPQWVYINITGTDLSNGGILALRIIDNNNASKKFFAKIQDIHGNSTEQILFTLQPGDNFYYIRLTEIEEVVDLSNPATLVLCFSWYVWEPSIDLTIVNMTLIML